MSKNYEIVEFEVKYFPAGLLPGGLGAHVGIRTNVNWASNVLTPEGEGVLGYHTFTFYFPENVNYAQLEEGIAHMYITIAAYYPEGYIMKWFVEPTVDTDFFDKVKAICNSFIGDKF